jgi:tetratricopeptide (TPR) repeat protein
MLGLSLSDAILPYLMVIGALAGGCAGYALGLRLRKLELWNSFSGFSIIRVLPFFLVALPLGAVTIYFQFNRAIGGEEIPIGNWWQRLVSASFAIAFYLYSAFWPFNIMGLYPEWQRAFPVFVTQPTPHVQPPAPESISFWIQVIPGLAIAGLLAFCWLRRTETWARALLVALGCYIIALLPELGLVRISYLRLTLFADHYQYISIIAIIALVVAAASARTLKPPWLYIASLCFAIISYFNWKQTPDTHFAQLIWIAGPLLLATVPTMAPQFMAYGWGAFAAAALACFSVISWGHAAIYHDEKTFFSATLKKNPYTWQGYNHLGAALYMEGNWRAAGLDFLKAVQLKPENPESHNNLGLYYSMLEDLPDAIREYRTAVNIKDDSAMRTNLANAYEHSKQYDPAIENYRHAIALNESNASAHCNLGYGLMQQGRIDEAIPEFMRTIELDPRMPQGPTNLAQALRIKGIDLNAPPVTGSFSFDANKAFELLRSAPPSPPRQHQPDR